MMIGLESAVRRHLLSIPEVAGYVGDKVWKYSLLGAIQGTGGRAIVVRRDLGWASPDLVQSSEYPTLVLDIWADCDRNAEGDKISDTAIANALAVYHVVDPHLHRQRDVWWGAMGSDPGYRVISSHRLSDPGIRPASEVAPGIKNTTEGTELIDCAMVTVSYGIHH